MAQRPKLLLCFDAFGTLFRPRYSVAKQYGDVARQCGLHSIRDEDVKPSLMAAMKAESKQNPNFGRATGLGATKWWTNVIHNTFTPLLAGSGQSIPADLAPMLLHRFATVEAYDLESADLVLQLRSLRKARRSSGESSATAICGPSRLYDEIVIGVVTNSDDRVPGILSSAGFDVSPLRYGTELTKPGGVLDETANQDGHGDGLRGGYDIDFHCMSYDVGVEKPDRAMFEAAESMLQRVLAVRGTASRPAAGETWQKIYVGDEYEKDVKGSLNVGWHSVLLSQDSPATTPDGRPIPMLEEMHEKAPGGVAGLFGQSPVIGIRSIGELVRWLRSDL